MSNHSDSPGYLLWQTHNRWQRELRKVLKPLGVTHVQFAILSAIRTASESSAPSQAKIAEMIGGDVMMVSTVVRELASRGLIERTRIETDTRIQALSLTKAGLKLEAEARAVVGAFDAQFFGPSSESMIRMLTKMVGQ
jgi:DNA-binding MarR family transcriptional regulator